MRPRGTTSFDDLHLFCAVARLRSFSRAARKLDMPLATVSRRVAHLERQLDAHLLNRTTRRVDPTDAGALLLARCEAPLVALGEAVACLGEESSVPRGRLRVTMPADLARHWLARPLANFAARHPEIHLELDLSSRVVNLVEEGFDLAIRAAEPDSGSLIARQLARMPTSLYASPGYLAALPALRHPRDLESVNALRLTGRSSDAAWSLRSGRERITTTPRGNLELDEMGALIGLAAAGAGVALLPDPLVQDRLADGSLVSLLPGWRGPDAPVFAVYASRRMPLRLRLLLDQLRAWVAEFHKRDGAP